MKIILAVFLFFATEIALSETQLFLPGIQIRYQDSAAQAREQKTYDSYSFQYQYNTYLIGFEYNQMTEDYGNISLKTENKTSEYLLMAGYNILTIVLDQSARDQSKKLLFGAARLELIAQGYFGKTQTTVKTSLLSQTTTNNSDMDDVIGAGGALLFKIGYFMASLDGKILQSKNFSPNIVPLGTLKVGVNLDL